MPSQSKPQGQWGHIGTARAPRLSLKPAVLGMAGPLLWRNLAGWPQGSIRPGRCCPPTCREGIHGAAVGDAPGRPSSGAGVCTADLLCSSRTPESHQLPLPAGYAFLSHCITFELCCIIYVSNFMRHGGRQKWAAARQVVNVRRMRGKNQRGGLHCCCGRAGCFHLLAAAAAAASASLIAATEDSRT